MIKRLGVLFLLLFCCAALSAAESSDGKFETDSIRRSLSGIEAICDYSIQKHASYKANGSGEESLPEKLEKGKSFFEKGDYAASADLFYAVVTLHSENDEMRREALFGLAESLYIQKNYMSAVKYYEMLIETDRNHSSKALILKRQLVSSYYLGKYADVKKYYDSFVEAGFDVSSEYEVSYYLGKSLFYDNRFSEAVKVFYSIKKDSIFYPQSRYFLGILSIKEHEYDDALSFYEEILSLENDGRYYNFEKVRELSVLAAARISFETGNLDKAANYYLLTKNQSGSFARAYYELAWTYVKTGNYNQAISMLRIAKSKSPNSDVVPEAEALEGTLLVQLKQYDDAMVLFDSMVKKYGRIQNNLFLIDGKIFMFNGQPRKVSDFLLPYSPIVRSLLKNNKKFKKAMNLNENILRIDEELKQLTSTENQIAAIIANKDVAALYTQFQAEAKQALFLMDRLAVTKHNIVMTLKNFIGKDIFWEQLRDFDELDSRKCQLLGISETKNINPVKIREHAAQYSKRVGRDQGEMRSIVKELDMLSKHLENLIVSYAALPSVPEDEEKKFFEKAIAEREALRNMILESDSYNAELDVDNAEVVFGGLVERRQNIIRESFNKLTDRQYTLLIDDRFSEIRELMEEANRIDRKLAEYYTALNNEMKERVDTIRVSYEKEKSAIDGYRSEFAGIRREFEEMAVLAMYSDLNIVKTAVSGYLLNSDLGIIDVMWEKKEDDSAEIVRLKTLKAQEIQQLYLNLDGEQ